MASPSVDTPDAPSEQQVSADQSDEVTQGQHPVLSPISLTEDPSQTPLEPGVSSTSYPIKLDIETLLNKFTKLESVRYDQFAPIWREMKMSMIFAGRQNDIECREFTEQCLRIAFSYFLPPCKFQVRIGALYTLYGLYYKQPFSPFVKIRVTFRQWQEIQAFHMEVKDGNHLDVDFILNKMLFDSAFSFVACSLPHQMKCTTTQSHPLQTSNSQSLNLLAESAQVRDIIDSEWIDQLSTIHEQYHRMKCVMNGPEATNPSPALDVITPSLVQDLTRMLASFDENRKVRSSRKGRRRTASGGATTSESESEAESKDPTYTTGAVRAALKEKAYSSVPTTRRSRRHRMHTSQNPQDTVQKPSRSEPASDDDENSKDASGNEPVASTSTEILSMPLLDVGVDQPKKKRGRSPKKTPVKAKRPRGRPPKEKTSKEEIHKDT